MNTYKFNLVDIEMYKHFETEKAILVSLDFPCEDDDKVWLPKYKIDIEYKSPFIVIVTMPENLAIEKELI